MPRTGNDKAGHRALRVGRASIPHQIYLVTTTTVQRKALFLNFDAARSAARCFENRQILNDSSLLAWVLMPDHVHWLLQLGERDVLDRLVSRLKSASARNANAILAWRGGVWVRSYHDHALRVEEDLPTIARYIVMNPVRAGLVRRIGDYPFWNAVWL